MTTLSRLNAERLRLENQRSGKENWRLWGPYLSERAWGTVREDYSGDGDAWGYLSHDQARSRAYRWSEDGLSGICDDQQRLCFALALWNGKDAILKERAFGLTGPQGNRGEDVKEYYFYRDATPSHSFLRYLYKYSQSAFPYGALVEENARRSRFDPPFNLIDTGAFEQDRYFDAEVVYAKASPIEIHIRIIATNRGPEAAELHLLPTLWFRNTWALGRRRGETRNPRDRCARVHGLGRRSGASGGRHALALRSTDGRTPLHRERKQRRAAVGPAQCDPLCEGCVPSPRDRRRRRRGQSRAHGDQIRRLAVLRTRARRSMRSSISSCRESRSPSRSSAAMRPSRRAKRRPTSSIAICFPTAGRRIEAFSGRRWPGWCGASSSSITTSSAGSRATSFRHRPSACADAMPCGST